MNRNTARCFQLGPLNSTNTNVRRAAAVLCALSLLAVAGPAPSQMTVTVQGSGNSATVAWPFVRGAIAYSVNRRTMSVEADGRILATGPWREVRRVAGSPYVDVVPQPSTLYEYRVDAVTRMDISAGPVVQYTSPPFTTPTNVVVTGAGSQVTLSWAPAIAVSGYHVIRYDPNRTQRTQFPITATTFVDAIPVLGTMYGYEVLSVDATGAMATSQRVDYKSPLVIIPPAVTILGTGDRATLTWTATAGALWYDVMRQVFDQNGQPLGSPKPLASRIAGLSFTDALPGPGTPLSYTVVAVGGDGNPITTSTAVSFTAAPYTTPGGLVAAGGGGKVSLSWRAASGITGYYVARRTVRPDGSVGDLVAPARLINTTDFVDTIPTPGLIYEYQVVGVGVDGRTWPSEWVRYAAGTW